MAPFLIKDEMLSTIRTIDEALRTYCQEDAWMARSFVAITGDFLCVDKNGFDGVQHVDVKRRGTDRASVSIILEKSRVCGKDEKLVIFVPYIPLSEIT